MLILSSAPAWIGASVEGGRTPAWKRDAMAGGRTPLHTAEPSRTVNPYTDGSRTSYGVVGNVSLSLFLVTTQQAALLTRTFLENSSVRQIRATPVAASLIPSCSKRLNHPLLDVPV